MRLLFKKCKHKVFGKIFRIKLQGSKLKRISSYHGLMHQERLEIWSKIALLFPFQQAQTWLSSSSLTLCNNFHLCINNSNSSSNNNSNNKISCHLHILTSHQLFHHNKRKWHNQDLNLLPQTNKQYFPCKDHQLWKLSPQKYKYVLHESPKPWASYTAIKYDLFIFEYCAVVCACPILRSCCSKI